MKMHNAIPHWSADMLSIASIDNLSGAAWRLAPPPAQVRLHFASPTAVYQALCAGACDAGLLPVARLRELSHRYEPLGAYGIACTGEVRSVVLYSRTPLQELLAAREPIFITRKSETSRRLLTVLARLAFGIDPVETLRHDGAAAELLIGDEAIAAREHSPYIVATDLGAWWHEQTGLPFVFARWVVRRNMPLSDRVALEEWVGTCADLARIRGGRDALVKRSTDMLDASEGSNYYSALRYRLTQQDCLAMTRFEQLQAEHAICRQTA